MKGIAWSSLHLPVAAVAASATADEGDRRDPKGGIPQRADEIVINGKSRISWLWER